MASGYPNFRSATRNLLGVSRLVFRLLCFDRRLRAGQLSEAGTKCAHTGSQAGNPLNTKIGTGKDSGTEGAVAARPGHTAAIWSDDHRQDAPPLAPHEKFHLFAKSAFDPISIVVVGVQAALSQADNQFPAYGQGAQGYGKRFGAALADEVDAGFWSNYAYLTLLKEDPRYFRVGEGSFLRRVELQR